MFKEDNFSSNSICFLSNCASDLMKMKLKERIAQTSHTYQGDYRHGMHTIIQMKIKGISKSFSLS